MPAAIEAFFVSLGVVGFAEMADKTQFLAIMLAMRYQRHLPILAGIAAATLLSQALAALLGQWLGELLTPERMRWIVGLSMLAVAAWTLRPPRYETETEKPPDSRYGAFGAAFIAFFIGEFADRTQFATAAIAARYQLFWAVTLGATVGMVAVNVPALWLGRLAAGRIPLKALRLTSAAIFAAVGIWILLA